MYELDPHISSSSLTLPLLHHHFTVGCTQLQEEETQSVTNSLSIFYMLAEDDMQNSVHFNGNLHIIIQTDRCSSARAKKVMDMYVHTDRTSIFLLATNLLVVIVVQFWWCDDDAW